MLYTGVFFFSNKNFKKFNLVSKFSLNLLMFNKNKSKCCLGYLSVIKDYE
jgi:hypothetical protein